MALATGAACRTEIPNPIWKGEHLHYGTTTSAPICRGSFYRQELHAVETARLLGFELSGVIHYTRATAPEVEEYCFGKAGEGCQYDDNGKNVVFSDDTFNFHEIAHAVVEFAGFLGAQPFAEGFAEVFGDGIDLDMPRVPIADVLHDFQLDDGHYYTMALFARFLIERHGFDQFIELLRATDWDDDFARMSAVFADVYGEPLDAAMTDFDAYPSCSEMSNRIAVVDCNLPLQPWDGGLLELTAEIDCSRDDVLGPTRGGHIYTTRAFEVTTSALYVLGTSEPDGLSFFRLVKCGSCWDSYDETFFDETFEIRALTPGRYYLMMGRHIDAPGEISFVIGS
jgi:hypothetical protein